MRILSATVGPLGAANAAIIAASQAGTAGTALTLTSAPYKLDSPRRIIITSAGDDSSHTFTIVGIPWASGLPSITETLTGSNGGAAQSVYDYYSITSITPVQNTAANVTVGTNTVASTPPLLLDRWGFAPTSLQIDVSGTVSVTAQQTLDDCNGSTGMTGVTWVNHPDSNLVNATGAVQGNYAYLPHFVRLLLNSGTGTATLKVLQAGPAAS